jgi:hypothetical protein
MATEIESSTFATTVYRCPAGATVYDAVLTQTGTSAPVATVAQKTIVGTFTWARTSAGLYTLTSTGTPFTANKTQIFMGAAGINGAFPAQQGGLFYRRTSTTVITVETAECDWTGPSFTSADGYLTEVAIRIVVTP